MNARKLWLVGCFAIGLAIPGFAATDGSGDVAGDAVPPGLSTYLEGRLLESGGRLSEAADKYEEAIDQAPDVNEIRVAYANVMLMTGKPHLAVEVLEGRDDLDWYGKRVLGMALGQVGGYDRTVLPRARKVLEEALAERGDAPNLMLTLARVLDELGDADEAAKVIGDLRRSVGGDDRLDVYHARLLLQAGRPGEAAEAVRRCAEAADGPPPCRELRVKGLIGSGQFDVAGDELSRWVEPDDYQGRLRAAAMLMQGGRSEQGLALLRKVLTEAPDTPGARELEADLLVRTGRFDEAIPKLKALLKKNPDDANLLLAMAWGEGKQGAGDMERARSYLNRAWESVAGEAGSPSATKVCLEAARLEIAGGHPTAAREWLGRISNFDVGAGEYPALLAATYRRGERWQEGAAALARLQPRLPESARPAAVALEIEFRVLGGDAAAAERLDPWLASDRLSEVLTALQVLQDLNRWAEVERAAEAALERFPDSRPLLFARASALERQDRLDDAAEIFERLLELDPEDFDVANYLGYMWADAGRNLERAHELISQAVEARPENPAFLDSLGWVEFRMGRPNQALYWLQRAVDLGGRHEGTVVGHLGEVLVALGRADEGEPMLRRALDLGCEDPDHVRNLLAGSSDAADE